LQFFKFENLVLLMQIANNSLDFKICRDRNIVDLKATLNHIKEHGKLLPYMTAESILIPFEQAEGRAFRFIDELTLGRLPEFCPDAY
jgi:hypothetical protein